MSGLPRGKTVLPPGDRLPAGAERLLHAFGPLGVAIGRTPPGVFRVVLRNMVRVVLTDRRLYGVRRPPWIARVFGAKERLEFEVPLPEIASVLTPWCTASDRGRGPGGGRGDSCASWLRFSRKIPSKSLIA